LDLWRGGWKIHFPKDPRERPQVSENAAPADAESKGDRSITVGVDPNGGMFLRRGNWRVILPAGDGSPRVRPVKPDEGEGGTLSLTFDEPF